MKILISSDKISILTFTKIVLEQKYLRDDCATGFWVQDQNNDNQHKIAAGVRRSPNFCGNSVTETEVGQQQQLQPPHKDEEALFQAASSTTSFKTNFVGIESWANFVTAKETPLME